MFDVLASVASSALNIVRTPNYAQPLTNPGDRDEQRFIACEKFFKLFVTLVKRCERRIPDRKGMRSRDLASARPRARAEKAGAKL